MLVVPVIDLLEGKAVHAIAGARDSYRPLKSQFGSGLEPRGLIDRLISESKCQSIYIADLDSIVNKEFNCLELLRLSTELGAQVWLDAGFDASTNSDQILENLADEFGQKVRPIVATEPQKDFTELKNVLARIPKPLMPLCSLDIKNGMVFSNSQNWEDIDLDSAFSQISSQVDKTIVLDIGIVGTGIGPNVELVSQLCGMFPDRELIWGGGIRDQKDLDRLELAGAKGAIVGTALHRGLIEI